MCIRDSSLCFHEVKEFFSLHCSSCLTRVCHRAITAAIHTLLKETGIGVARIFSEGGGRGRRHFLLDQKSDTFFCFLVITLSYMVIYVIYCHQLPFYLICGGAPRPNSAPFLPHSNKNAYKNFFCRPGEYTCTPYTSWLHLWRRVLQDVILVISKPVLLEFFSTAY